jgi:CRP-like cAMP-binding protein
MPRRPPPQIKTRAFLANLPIFSEMGATELDRIAAATVPLYFDKGQSIVQCGDPCTGFHLVVYGQVKLAFTSPQGVEKVVEIIRPGQSFGEALMFLDKPYVVFAQALADSMLLHVTKQAVFEELGPNPFARRMIAGLARRLHGLETGCSSASSARAALASRTARSCSSPSSCRSRSPRSGSCGAFHRDDDIS